MKKLFVIVCSGCYKNTIYQVVCKPQKFISLSSRCWKSKIMVSAWSGSGAGPHLDYRLPTSRCDLIYQNEGERVLEGLFLRTLIPSMRPLHSRLGDLITSQIPTSQSHHMVGWGFQHMKFGITQSLNIVTCSEATDII